MMKDIFRYIKRKYLQIRNTFFFEKYGIDSNKVYTSGLPVIIYKGNSGGVKVNKQLVMVNDNSNSVLNKTQKCKLMVYGGAYIDFKGTVRMSNTTIIASKGITFGDNVMIGGGVTIADTDFHSMDYTNWGSENDEKLMARSEIEIGNNVFIGMDSVILKGVTIGDGAVVAARSVCTKNIPANEIWGGNPAKFIKHR